MSLSEQVWKKSKPLIDAIHAHPFNQKLMQGTLSRDAFAYYIEQDTLYLQAFARCHALVAARAPLAHVKTFLAYAEESLIAEQEVVHAFFRQLYQFKETGRLTPATISYTSYLLQTCALAPVEVAVAALLPCFWVYMDVGNAIAKNAVADNAYAKWIETYSSDAFSEAVHGIIAIFDELAEQSTEAIRLAMEDAFYKSTCLEWHFWQDAYLQIDIDPTQNA